MINDKGEETGIIYGWYCIVTDKWYIGQTIDEQGRFKRHIDDAINKKDNIHFHRALRKYGLDNWVYCILESNILKVNLNLKEQEWIEYYDSFYNGYNLTLGGRKNTIFSEESRRKLSKSHKGKKTWNSGKTNIYSNETRRKMSESHKGKPCGHPRPVNKYDLNGNYIRTYNSIAEAKIQNHKCSNIVKVCRGERKQTGGFIWKYA